MANTTTVNNYTFTEGNGLTSSEKQAFRNAVRAIWEPLIAPNPKYPGYVTVSGSGVLSNGLLPTTSGWPTLSIIARKLYVPELTKVVFDSGKLPVSGGTKSYYVTSLGGERVTITDADGAYTAAGFYGAIRDSDFEYQNILDATLNEIMSVYNNMPLRVRPPLYDIRAIFSQYSPADVPGAASAKFSGSTTVTSDSISLKVMTFHSSFNNTTLLSSNNLPYRIGDRISLQGFKIPTTSMYKNWGGINGLYTVKGITGSIGFNSSLYVEGGPAWSEGSPANAAHSLSVPFLSSVSTNGFVAVTPRPDNEQNLFGTYITLSLTTRINLRPELLFNPGVVVVRGQKPIPLIVYKPPTNTPSTDNPTVGIFPVTDPYIEPVQTTPTKPAVVTPPNVTTPTTPTSKPTPIVKLAGTTVSIPFLTNASFKPGTSAAANAKGKTAFINLVKKASVSSRLTQAQSAQLMATVIKAIDDALLVKKNSLTRLRPAPVVTRNPIKKLNQ